MKKILVKITNLTELEAINKYQLNENLSNKKSLTS